MARFSGLLRSMAVDEEGATMVEYGIMLALIAAVCVGIIATLGVQVQGLFDSANTAF